ncbi:MAG: hypothetical protein QM484_07110 [Woeseiaceae bacterium]
MSKKIKKSDELNLFLKFIEQDIERNPDSIMPISKKELDEIESIVEGIKDE